MSNAFPQQAMKSLKDHKVSRHFSSVNSFISIKNFPGNKQFPQMSRARRSAPRKPQACVAPHMFTDPKEQMGFSNIGTPKHQDKNP